VEIYTALTYEKKLGYPCGYTPVHNAIKKQSNQSLQTI